MTLLCSAALLAGLLLLGVIERRARDRALAAIPVRIHVNGTRGKSTVTRLIAGALREAGVRTVAKTTGTEPRLILPDGSERAIRRRAPASVREQLWFLRVAQRMGAGAAVIECMAIDPQLQAASEHQMIRSTIGVITNARSDHAEDMGTTVEEVAAALSNTIPARAVVVIGPTDGAASIERAARAQGSRAVRAGPDVEAGSADGAGRWAAENAGVALAVTRALGVPDGIARRGMLRAAPDPGAVRSGEVDVSGRRVRYVDAAAANDPQSLSLLLEPRVSDALFVFHNRQDRPARLSVFAGLPPWERQGDELVVTGDRPDWMTWRALHQALPGSRLAYVAPGSLADDLRRRLGEPAGHGLLVFCGNTRHFRRDAVLADIGRG